MEIFTFTRSKRLLSPRTLTRTVPPRGGESSHASSSHSLLVRVSVGGDQERVEIHLIAPPGLSRRSQVDSRTLLTEQFATFNAGKAQCFLASDREHLLAVIEAGFGDFYDFNRAARNLLASGLRNPSFPLAPPSSGGLRGTDLAP